MGELLTGLGLSSDVALGITIYGIVLLAALWLAMIVWAYRDMRSRSRDTFAHIGSALLIALLLIPGLIIYLLVRPRETLSEAYERSLEEEALLQEIEEKPTCPGCGQRVQSNWQACPHCFTRLKKPCVHCHQMLELSWQVCPYCTTQQRTVEQGSIVPQYARPVNMPEEAPSQPVRVRRAVRNAEPLEFIEGDDYTR
ncbi:MAG: zinc ribbon domain-containing protein [Chloroflexi bacterium]|nr:zinc ribbon domain-containing protein [Chloroflexota bacterium]MCC6891209.1 zinc ribbon domain-containing protein [Anaerolineae bacterium]